MGANRLIRPGAARRAMWSIHPPRRQRRLSVRLREAGRRAAAAEDGSGKRRNAAEGPIRRALGRVILRPGVVAICL